MCKVMADMRAAAALEAEIPSAVQTCRDLGQTDEQIRTYLMKRFEMTKENARLFMAARPAA